MVGGPDKQLARYALGLKRQDLRILIGLNRHLTIMKIFIQHLQPHYGEEYETPYHLGYVLPIR